MNKRITFFVLLIGISLACSFLSPVPPSEAGNVEMVAGDDTEMNAAILEAQETLPLFIQAFQNPKSTQTYFGIKAKFPYGDGDSAEHLWLSDLSYKNNLFIGVVGNEPVYVKTIQMGDQISVSIADISDWMIIEENRLLGGFTIHALRNNLTPSEREKFDNELGFIISDEPELP